MIVKIFPKSINLPCRHIGTALWYVVIMRRRCNYIHGSRLSGKAWMSVVLKQFAKKLNFALDNRADMWYHNYLQNPREYYFCKTVQIQTVILSRFAMFCFYRKHKYSKIYILYISNLCIYTNLLFLYKNCWRKAMYAL